MLTSSPYFWLHLYVITIFFIGCYRYGKAIFFVAALGFIHLNILLWLGKGKNLFISAPFLFSGYTFFALTSVLLVVYFFRMIEKTRTEFFKRKLQEEKNRYSELEIKDKRVKEKIHKLEADAAEIGLIYESIKDMNLSLDLDDSFEVFSRAFSDLIEFGKGEMVLLKKEDDKIRIKEIYTITDDFENCKLTDNEVTDKHWQIVDEVKKRKKMFFGKNKDLDEGIDEIINDSVPSIPFISIPLVAENEIVAILIVENLKKEHLRKVLLLTTPFALEIEKAYLYEKVKELSWIDSLTGLYLPRYFFQLMDDELKRAIENNETISFLMIDIDSFKKYNDECGHLVGDIIIKHVASIIKENGREFDIVGRYGGDEFILVLPTAQKKQAFYIAQRIKNEVDAYEIKIEGIKKLIKVSISVGISSYPEDGTERKSLIDKADFALYRSKKIGRNAVTLFDHQTGYE
ncbi:GGDEF domain-containing protein [Candidatus Auribacterota bacterium]